MTNRISYAPQDFQKMCEQAERDHEERKITLLLERVKRQIADQKNPAESAGAPKPPMGDKPELLRMPARSAPFER
jgi:hypothetical protein